MGFSHPQTCILAVSAQTEGVYVYLKDMLEKEEVLLK